MYQTSSFEYGYVCLSPYEQIGYHEQASWELSAVLQGTGKRKIGDTEEDFQAGEVILIPPQIPHGWTFSQEGTDKNGKITNITLTFSDSLLANCVKDFPELLNPIQKLEAITEAIRFKGQKASLLLTILKAMRRQNKIERLASFIRLLSIFPFTEETRTVGNQTHGNKYQKRMEKIQAYFKCNAFRPITLNDIVRYLGMNKSSFCTFFKQATGKTFVTFLNEYRIEQACLLLKNQQMNISEIAYSVGFSHIPYFNRIFKKLKNCSPKNYAQQMRNKTPDDTFSTDSP